MCYCLVVGSSFYVKNLSHDDAETSILVITFEKELEIYIDRFKRLVCYSYKKFEMHLNAQTQYHKVK